MYSWLQHAIQRICRTTTEEPLQTLVTEWILGMTCSAHTQIAILGRRVIDAVWSQITYNQLLSDSSSSQCTTRTGWNSIVNRFWWSKRVELIPLVQWECDIDWGLMRPPSFVWNDEKIALRHMLDAFWSGEMQCHNGDQRCERNDWNEIWTTA